MSEREKKFWKQLQRHYQKWKSLIRVISLELRKQKQKVRSRTARLKKQKIRKPIDGTMTI